MNKNIRPEMLKPEFEIYEEVGEERIKLQKCNSMGVPTKFPSVTSALVPIETKNLVVKLPKHRVFVILGPEGPRQVEGFVNIPEIATIRHMHYSYFNAGAILEVDKKTLLFTDKYKYPRDINHKYISPENTYLFTGQVVMYRGENVATVGYLESSPDMMLRNLHKSSKNHSYLRIGPNLRKNKYLGPLLGLVEQEHISIVSKDPEKQRALGTRVLEYAASINYFNQSMVQSSYSRKPKKQRSNQNDRSLSNQ